MHFSYCFTIIPISSPAITYLGNLIDLGAVIVACSNFATFVRFDDCSTQLVITAYTELIYRANHCFSACFNVEFFRPLKINQRYYVSIIEK